MNKIQKFFFLSRTVDYIDFRLLLVSKFLDFRLLLQQTVFFSCTQKENLSFFYLLQCFARILVIYACILRSISENELASIHKY